MNIPKHVLNCPWVGQQHDILSFCEHLILRLWSIFSQNDNSVISQPIETMNTEVSLLISIYKSQACLLLIYTSQ